MSVSKQVSLLNRLSRKFNSSSENIGPAGVLCFSYLSCVKSIVAYIDKYLELLFTREIVFRSSLCDDLENLCFSHNQQ